MFKCVLAVTGLIGLMVSGAQAQITQQKISAFNSAVGSGDVTALKTAAIGIVEGAIADPADPRSDQFVFEVAKTLCVKVNCEEADTARAHLLAREGKLQGVPQLSADLVTALIAYKAKSTKETRKDLDAVLDAYVAQPPDLLSVMAYAGRYNEDIANARWKDARASTVRALKHLEGAKTAAPQLYYTARRVSLVAEFMADHEKDASVKLAHHYGEIRQMHAKADVAPDWLEEEYWSSQAWLDIQEAWFLSEGKRHKALPADERAAILAKYPLQKNDDHDDDGKSSDDRPFCAGRMIQSPELDYPSAAAFRGYLGAIYLRVSLDDKGRVINPKVLASVPVKGFTEHTLETVKKWRWKKSKDAKKNCRLSRDNIIIPFNFTMAD